MVNDIDLTHFEPVNVVFLIAQKGNEDFSDEEQRVAVELGVAYVDFEHKMGVYKNKEDAIAVAKELIKNDPTRKLAVISATT